MNPRKRADSDVSSLADTKGRQVAAGGNEVIHVSGHQTARQTSRGATAPSQVTWPSQIVAHFSNSICDWIPQSPLRALYLLNQSSDEAFPIPREEAVNFLPHPPTAAEHSYAVVPYDPRIPEGLERLAAVSCPRASPERVQTGPSRLYPRAWVVPYTLHRVRAVGPRPYS